MSYENEPLTGIDQQLTGADYDHALHEVEHLNDIYDYLITQERIINNSIEIAEGQRPTAYYDTTTDGLAQIAVEPVYISPESIPEATRDLEDLWGRMDAIKGTVDRLKEGMWQEGMSRLMDKFRANEADDYSLLKEYFELWNNYLPDNYLEVCDIHKQEATSLVRASLERLATKWNGISFTYDSPQANFQTTFGYLAEELDIDISEYNFAT